MSGKWHNGAPSVARTFQIARGVFTGGMTNPLRAQLSNLDGGKLTTPMMAKEHTCQVFANEAASFIHEQKKGPFLCYVPFDAPHDPHVVPEEFPIHYDPASIPLPANFLPLHPFNNGEMTVRDEQLLPWPRTGEEVQRQLAEYYRYISYLDSLIGQILDALQSSPFAKNTIVVFAADSGVARGSHGLIGKQNLYEHSIRVPLIISGPGIPADKCTNAMCYLYDVMPTLGSICHVPAPQGSEGIDFSGALKDPTQSARTSLVFAYKTAQRAIRDNIWKLIRYPKVNVTQLFDLVSDPDETRNLADAPEKAGLVRTMRERLASELKAAGDNADLTVSAPEPSAISADQLNERRPKQSRPERESAH